MWQLPESKAPTVDSVLALPSAAFDVRPVHHHDDGEDEDDQGHNQDYDGEDKDDE